MIRPLARLVGWGPPPSGPADDALGEFLREPAFGDVAPEVLLRIL